MDLSEGVSRAPRSHEMNSKINKFLIYYLGIALMHCARRESEILDVSNPHDRELGTGLHNYVVPRDESPLISGISHSSWTLIGWHRQSGDLRYRTTRQLGATRRSSTFSGEVGWILLRWFGSAYEDVLSRVLDWFAL
jgi:hypothetical protein